VDGLLAAGEPRRRRWFGTDGVRGVVGETLTPQLVERLGRAVTLWSGRGRVLVGRDTRGSGPELEEALARGIVEAGGTAVLAGVLPTPAVALLAQDLGLVVSASHNPPEYNGIKVFDHEGHKLVDADELEIEALMDTPGPGGGSIEHVEHAAAGYVDHVVEHFGSDLSGLRIAVDCANGAYSDIARGVFERLGADATSIASTPDGTNINVGCGATDLSLLRSTVRAGSYDLGVAFDGDGDRMLAVDASGETVDGDQILAICALALQPELVVVTTMTNLGLHRLMDEHGIRVVTTDVGDRYVLEALHAEGGVLGGEQSGHLIVLDGHVTGDGLAAALTLCKALDGRPLAKATAVMPRFAQAKENVRVHGAEVPAPVVREVERLNGELVGRGRVLVRLSGTEPLIRVLAEMETMEEAEALCASIASLVRREAATA
jgi:phosphoglucosamine mutase